MARSVVGYKGRSQPRGTQRDSQSQPTQTQCRRRGTTEDDEEQRGDDNDEDEDEEEEEEEEERPRGDSNEDQTRRANALVRLALFGESRRVPLRRDEINKKIMGPKRDFTEVFNLANKSLQSVFGVELVELMSRAEREREQNANDEIQDDANATGLKKKTTASGSKSYILRSTLSPTLIEAAAAADEQILEEEFLEGDDDEDEVPRSYGSIISWSTADQLSGLGLLHVILALILVSGNTLNDLDLKKHLKSFRLPLTATIEFAPHATHKNTSIEAYLSSLVKQGYLDKVKVGPAGAPRATQGKRGRGKEDNEEGASFEWKWGSRAQAEVGEQAIAHFVAEFMVERILKAAEKDKSDSEDEAANRNKKKGKKRRADEDEKEKMLENMLKDITRTAGGKLKDIR